MAVRLRPMIASCPGLEPRTIPAQGTVTKRYKPLAPVLSFGSRPDPAALWLRLLRAAAPDLAPLLLAHGRLAAEHPHGLTVAAAPPWAAQALARRRDAIERAARNATGRALCVHVVAATGRGAGR